MSKLLLSIDDVLWNFVEVALEVARFMICLWYMSSVAELAAGVHVNWFILSSGAFVSQRDGAHESAYQMHGTNG